MRISHLHGVATRLRLAAVFGLVACLAVFARDTARAQAPLPPANFAYTVYLPGWNLISPGGQDAIDVGSLTAVLSGSLFTFQPNDASYETTNLGNVKPGFGYWANFTKTTAVALDKSSRDSYTVTVPAGQCVLVGNPSTKGSARITGAERSYVFSTAANTYVAGSLVGIGRGAWACNDTRTSVVSVAFTVDVNGANWPDCCGPTPSDNRGQSFLVFKNDSPYPLIVGMRQMDQNGEYLDDGDLIRGKLDGCVTCPEYDPSRHTSCSGDAVTQSIDLTPGDYTLHLQADGPNVPDLQASVSVAPNTTYTLCYFVDATRPQKSLP
jgi:hypothetical protein